MEREACERGREVMACSRSSRELATAKKLAM
jgi:hypothetical protein